MLELTDANYRESLQKGKFLFMFYTDWCPLCPIIIGKLRELEAGDGGRFTFAKINHDENPAAAEAYGAFGVPIVLAVIDGKALYGTAGQLLIEGYRMMVDELLYDFDEALLEEKIKRIQEAVDKLLWEQIPQEPV